LIWHFLVETVEENILEMPPEPDKEEDLIAESPTSQTPTTSTPTSDADDNSTSSYKPKYRPPPIHIPNSNFSDSGNDESGNSRSNGDSQKNEMSSLSSSPTGRKCLVKQSGVCEDSRNGFTQAKADSPKFLIPPGKFDSTPRLVLDYRRFKSISNFQLL
jgi:hypothetical protein